MNALARKFFKTAKTDKPRHHRILQMLSASERRDFEVGPNDLPFRQQNSWEMTIVKR